MPVSLAKVFGWVFEMLAKDTRAHPSSSKKKNHGISTAQAEQTGLIQTQGLNHTPEQRAELILSGFEHVVQRALGISNWRLRGSQLSSWVVQPPSRGKPRRRTRCQHRALCSSELAITGFIYETSVMQNSCCSTAQVWISPTECEWQRWEQRLGSPGPWAML